MMSYFNKVIYRQNGRTYLQAIFRRSIYVKYEIVIIDNLLHSNHLARENMRKIVFVRFKILKLCKSSYFQPIGVLKKIWQQA